MRNINLDIIRIIAFCFVPSVHFFLHSGFYSNAIDTPEMKVMLFMRTLFLTCIPLFLLLTGYLQGEKKITPNTKYFLKIGKFIIPYLIIMFIDLVIINEILTPSLPTHPDFKPYTTKQYIQNFTSFTHYSWYVEMYIGLFLLIPFLNMIWQNLRTKGQELFLIISLIALTILPSFFNVYEFKTEDWLSAANTSNWKLFPSWWTKIYPLTYYFVGAFMARHKKRLSLNPIVALVLFLATWYLSGSYVFRRCEGLTPTIYAFTDYNSPVIFATGVTLFIFVNSLPLAKTPNFIRKFVGKLSDLTFGAYLGSWALDQILYTAYINKKHSVYEDRWSSYPLAMLIVIPTAFLIAYFTDLLYRTGKDIFKCNKKQAKTK
ncbi:MAG: acyltransferase family protein [Ruminococcus sp.]|nr:acyltransferase family protein [Ruminococcus sp.]